MTSLTQLWASFLRSPKPDMLTDDATMTYITSCKQFTGTKDIVRQMAITSDGLKSLKDEVTCSHEAHSSLVSEVAASFIFEFDGKMNPFLPGLEDNMYSGKRVEVPLIYSVTFSSQKIRAIRVFWDQATVLKQIDVIGIRGRGWPVYDGAEQSRLLRSGAKPETAPARAQDTMRPTTGTYDPHATLHLFEQHPDEPRSDYGPQDYQERVKAEPSKYDDLFITSESARPDELTQRLGSGHQRQVTLGQSQYGNVEDSLRNVNLNESIGHAGRTSHFEFGTPDANSSDFQKNEIPLHRKGGIQDHNRTTREYEEPSMRGQQRAQNAAHFKLGADSPSPALQQNGQKGPPQASYDTFSEQQPEQERYNMGRRPPPQSQFDFASGDDQAPRPHASRAASHNYEQSKREEQDRETGNVHGRTHNMSRRPPPQAQYDLLNDSQAPEDAESRRRFATGEREQSENIHGRSYNMSRNPPPQAQYDFMDASSSEPQQNFGRSRSQQTGGTQNQETDNIHGRTHNMSRNAPPQPQYDFMAASTAEPQQSFGRSSGQRSASSEQRPEADNVHGRTHNMSRNPPPQAQYDFMAASTAEPQQSYGRSSSSRQADPEEEPGSDNIHQRAFNMSRRPPPQAQYDFMSAGDVDTKQNQVFGRSSQRNFSPSYEFGDGGDGNANQGRMNSGRQGPPAPQSDFL